jgi:type II secretory pathway pseudopilin PulG
MSAFVEIKLKLKRPSSSGITLMELIVVIIISGLIAGTFAAVFYNVTNSALKEATREELDMIAAALLDFHKDCDQFPSDTGAVSTDFLDLSNMSQPADARFGGSAALQSYRAGAWDGPYLQDKFDDDSYQKDAWQNDYVYDYTYGDDFCVVSSYGPDGASGGDDDIVVRANAKTFKEEKVRRVKDELDIIQLALADYIRATGSAPSAISDLFEWEVLNLKMDESLWTGAADEVVDYSGMGNHGTAYGGADTIDSGKVGKAGSFDESASSGAGQYISKTGANLGLTEITVEAWIKPEIATDQRAPIVRVDRFYFQVYEDNRLAAYWYGKSSAGYHYSTLNSINTGEWSHVVVVWDEDGVSFYINGSLDNSVSTSGTGESTNWIHIGREGTSRRYNGLIDEVRIYGVALSADEIFYRYNNPGYPRDYFDLHNHAFKYDAWENEYQLSSMSVGGQTVHYFYSFGFDRDSGGGDDIKPRGL